MNDIPDWAGTRACELLNNECATDYWDWPKNQDHVPVRTVAKLVMQHEQPPVDPDEEADPDVAAVVRIWGAIYGIYDIKPGFLRPSHALARAVSQYKQERGMVENPPAFPSAAAGFGNTGYDIPGMTLRDWFAGRALSGMSDDGNDWSANDYAKWAYALADAMLAERSK